MFFTDITSAENYSSGVDGRTSLACVVVKKGKKMIMTIFVIVHKEIVKVHNVNCKSHNCFFYILKRPDWLHCPKPHSDDSLINFLLSWKSRYPCTFHFTYITNNNTITKVLPLQSMCRPEKYFNNLVTSAKWTISLV